MFLSLTGSSSPYLFLFRLPLGPSQQPDLSVSSSPCLGPHLPLSMPSYCVWVAPISPSEHLFLHSPAFSVGPCPLLSGSLSFLSGSLAPLYISLCDRPFCSPSLTASQCITFWRLKRWQAPPPPFPLPHTVPNSLGISLQVLEGRLGLHPQCPTPPVSSSYPPPGQGQMAWHSCLLKAWSPHA